MSPPQYPPPSGPPQPGWAAPPPAPRKSGAGKIVGFGCLGIVLLFVLFGIVAVAVSGGSSDDDPKPGASRASGDAPAMKAEDGVAEAETEPEPAGPTGDVTLTACEIEPYTTWPSAKLTITNRSSKTSNYMVEVEFVDAKGTRISEGYAATNNLRPGRTAKEEAQGTAEATGKVTCRVTEVTRYAS
ncbi:FxLYD domain-containing protein [Streptomyces sp. NPDC088733]|uniref:FxLYD domain-containing protein n=1 Tax=Streptomyces sp. NPDC088733 TaxID=3365880 RepID=UPI003821AF8A